MELLLWTYCSAASAARCLGFMGWRIFLIREAASGRRNHAGLRVCQLMAFLAQWAVRHALADQQLRGSQGEAPRACADGAEVPPDPGSPGVRSVRRVRA